MTRGIRNNNPLNIRRTKTAWQGMKTEMKDKSSVEFKTLPYGYRAAWKTLDTYFRIFERECKPYTVRNIIARWAPPNENDTKSYIGNVLRLTSLGGKENLPQPSRRIDIERLERLLSAMTTMECGIPYGEVDKRAIREGYRLAFPGKRSYARTQPAEAA